MTTLLIDLGNSRLKWALAGAAGLGARGAFAHEGTRVADTLERALVEIEGVDGVYAASVAPLALDEDIDALVRRRYGIGVRFVRSPASALGVRNAYAEPARLGVDRFLGLAALHAAHARAQVLVGIGTAMTLDALAADGAHLGGWILPSPALMRDAVLARTARVGVADGRVVDLADNTADALRSGSVQAAVGAIERFAANAAHRLDSRPAVVMTGGGAQEIAPLVPGAEEAPDLVLHGLALWANAARSPESAGGTR